jgi:hypothetical protein
MMSLVGMTSTTRAPSYSIACYNVKVKIKLSSTHPNNKILPLLVNAYFIQITVTLLIQSQTRTCQSAGSNLQPLISYTKATVFYKNLQNSTLIAIHKVIIGFII